jgi:hypothetical protein
MWEFTPFQPVSNKYVDNYRNEETAVVGLGTVVTEAEKAAK